MEDIELVIKISNYDKEWITNGYYIPEEINTRIAETIANGIPLPEGHGKIIDYGYVVDAIDDWVNAEEYRYTNATDYLRKRVANTPTIIEADKESEG